MMDVKWRLHGGSRLQHGELYDESLACVGLAPQRQPHAVLSKSTWGMYALASSANRERDEAYNNRTVYGSLDTPSARWGTIL